MVKRFEAWNPDKIVIGDYYFTPKTLGLVMLALEVEQIVSSIKNDHSNTNRPSGFDRRSENDQN